MRCIRSAVVEMPERYAELRKRTVGQIACPEDRGLACTKVFSDTLYQAGSASVEWMSGRMRLRGPKKKRNQGR
jgi:hypothetical protein